MNEKLENLAATLPEIEYAIHRLIDNPTQENVVYLLNELETAIETVEAISEEVK